MTVDGWKHVLNQGTIRPLVYVLLTLWQARTSVIWWSLTLSHTSRIFDHTWRSGRPKTLIRKPTGS